MDKATDLVAPIQVLTSPLTSCVIWVGQSLKICFLIYKTEIGASLVAQWLRICLPMQGTRVQALVWEDPTCRRATRPVSHNY